MSTPQVGEQLATTVLRKVIWRLIPFMFLLFILNILDRVNVNFARLQMLDQLHLSEQVFGLGASIFFIGYFVFQVPSNLIMNRIGARQWISGIVVGWGLISCAMMFIRDEWSFYTLRFLLGLAESGFFPGMILYLTYWIPAGERARATACFMSAAASAGLIGGPLSGALMYYLDGVAGMAGWQWMFLLEGLPTVIMGFVVLVWLTDRPEVAGWLTDDERSWLSEQMNREAQQRQQQHGFTLQTTLANGRVWLLTLLYFMLAAAVTGFVIYLPQFVKEKFPDQSLPVIGLLTAIPYLISIVSMILSSAHSDRTGERRLHVAIPSFIAAVGWALGAYFDDRWLVLAALSVAAAGMYSSFGPFWSLPNAFLTGTAAAGGIALINSIGNLGGFVAPIILSEVKAATKSFGGGMLAMSLTMLIACGLALSCQHDRTSEKDGARP
ncbi:MAG: putative transporter, Major facilitator superfamily [Planctomycetaceae bacterium]|nr:putative transporter, Major facilitator superfamily [Planctomycetaceae bacterium]